MKKKILGIGLSHTVKFESKWVCLDEQNRVCGVGKTAQKALKDAEDRGYKMPTLYFVNPYPFIGMGYTAPATRRWDGKKPNKSESPKSL